MNTDNYCPICKSCPLITDYCPNCSRIEGHSGIMNDEIESLRQKLAAETEAKFKAIGIAADLTNQLAACQKDAERYRWLRDQVSHKEFVSVAQCVWKRNNDPYGEWVNLIDAADMDKHIDAAMEGTK